MMSLKRSVSVSVIAPNYNNGKYLPAFIKSVTNSSVLPKELIIIDDGSTDNSKEILDSYKLLEFIKIIHFDHNRGLTSALNAGITASTCNYIMRADPDDLLLPDRIERQFHFMENHPEIDVVGCNVLYFEDTSGKKINISNFPLRHKEIESAYRRGEHGIQHPTAFIKTEVFKKYRYQPIFPGEDYEIFARMIKDQLKFANLSEPLYLMRVHAGSSTSNLDIKAIRQTFKFRDQIFGTKTYPIWVRMYYIHIRHYRRYQISKNGIGKYLHLFLSGLMYPAKIWRRIKSSHNIPS